MSSQVTRKTLVLCRGPYCSLDGRADRLYKQAQSRIDAINADSYPPRVRLQTANCLDMCGAGPNCILHPGGWVFNHLDEETLNRIIDENLEEK